MVRSLLLVLLSLISYSEAATRTDFKHVETMNGAQFENFKESPDIRVAYFYKREVPRLPSFYREYERSAELLATYHVKCAVVDCTQGKSTEHCQKKKGEHFVYAFRDGYELLQMELETMFDVNSIMSNILQLVLLRDVPIVQTEEEFAELENSAKGQHDLIFSYHRAIGTYEHRLFMEVAYLYQSKYKFGVTTEKSTISSLPDAMTDSSALCMLWALDCKNAPRTSPEGITHCPAVKFIGKLELVDVASFVKSLSLPNVYNIPEDGVTSPYTEVVIHTLYLYHDKVGQVQAHTLAQGLGTRFRGIVGIITVNVESPNLPEEYTFQGPLPTAKLKLKRVNDDRFMSGEMDIVSLGYFVRDALEDFMRGVRKDTMTEPTQPVSENYAAKMDQIEQEVISLYLSSLVEQLDDQVAKSVHDLKKKDLRLENIPALTDKTFPQTLQQKDLAVILFYLKVNTPSAAFLHAYAEAGASFKSPDESPLARVECFDWTDVCQKENITMYPTVHFYRKGQRQMVYNGHLGTDSILSAIKLYQLDGFVKPVNKEEVTLFSKGLFPEDIRQSTPVSVLGLMNSDTDIEQFHMVAMENAHRAPFGLVTESTLAKQIAADYGVTSPAVLLFKRNDPLKPVEIYKKEMIARKIGMFVSAASLPLFGQLTPANMPQVYQQFKPLVLVFLGPGDQGVVEAVSEVAQSGEFTWAIYTWMNVSGMDNLGSTLLYHYTKQPRLPHICLIIRHKSEVYNFPGVEFSMKTISKWLREIHQEKVSPSMNLPRGTWRPKHEGYDFLRMIDEGVDDRVGEDDMVGIANEEGIGFDADGHYSMEQGLSEEDKEFSQSVDEFYKGDQPGDVSEEVDTIEHSRLGHQKRDKPKITESTTQQGPITHQGPTTPQNPEVKTHDGGEL
ncbi:thioredoxin domain-containing protein 16-like [Liolophura sinensis]|uniref:thioredoxin domain-containing protein 16-like n=1 Tax=Liolophura sinensis TaxID=3198878 RepID=UPI003158C681